MTPPRPEKESHQWRSNACYSNYFFLRNYLRGTSVAYAHFFSIGRAQSKDMTGLISVDRNRTMWCHYCFWSLVLREVNCLTILVTVFYVGSDVRKRSNRSDKLCPGWKNTRTMAKKLAQGGPFWLRFCPITNFGGVYFTGEVRRWYNSIVTLDTPP